MRRAIIRRLETTPTQTRLLDAMRKATDYASHLAMAIAIGEFDDDFCTRRTIATHISRMRAKGFAIETVPGYGYRLISESTCPTCGHTRGTE